MSGGANRKKSNRTQGWEEAGLEFYQESYPSNPSDFDVLQQNPKHLTTLLPSKQSRAVTTMRNHGNDTRTVRRHQSIRRESTVRRASAAPDEVQVALMPDLSQDLSNEKKVWNEVMDIKSRPIPMCEKRQQKAAIQNEPNLRLQGYDQFKWKQKQLFQRFQVRIKQTFQKLELWRSTLKTIEGNYGTGVVSYFIFIKCLMFLNLFMFTLVFLFIILPMLLTNNLTQPCETNECCTQRSKDLEIVNLLQGDGILKKSIFYYGAYKNHSIDLIINQSTFNYNIPLAYIVVTFFCFLVSLIWIVREAAKGFKERLVEGEGQFYNYCNTVFASWDFCIENQKAANKKHEAIYKELKNSLECERDEENRKTKTHEERTKVLIIRILVNILVVTVLLAAAAAIYFVFEFSNNGLKSKRPFQYDLNNLESILYEFFPSLSIVLLNMTLPFLFYYLSSFENYNPDFEMRITLVRTVFLRLFSLFVLYASFYIMINYEYKNNDCTICWETYIGQQMYKLALVDFVNHLFTTFVVNFVRSRIGKLRNKFARFIGVQSFDLPKHVLDVVYLQTVCWFGMFYAPFLPAMFTIVLFCMFYVKKFACLINSKPANVLYRVSRSNSMFMIVLLVCFLTAVLPIIYSVSELRPSLNCGPFRGRYNIWEFIIIIFFAFPQWIKSIVTFICTSAFCIPIFLILSLCLYYYIAVTSANRHMVIVLKNQLVLEGHDKQFLLEKLSSFIKQQQHLQKRARQNSELMMREGDRNIASN